MTMPWEKYKTNNQIPPWEKYSQNLKFNSSTSNRKPYSKLESFGMGALEGGTFGFADELKGIIDILSPSSFVNGPIKTYQKSRDKIRGEMQASKEDNPDVYTSGEIGGSIATAFIPGLGWMNAAKGAKILNAMAKGAVSGGIIGAGTSNADLTEAEDGDFAGDVAGGAFAGGAIGGITNKVGNALSQLNPKNVAKKAANVFLGTPEELTETYIKNPQGVLNAPLRHELATSIEKKGITPLKKQVFEGSKKSRDILDAEGKKIPGSEIAVYAQDLADDLEHRLGGIYDDPQRQAAIKWLRNIQKEYGIKYTPEKTETSTILNEYGKPHTTVTPSSIKDQSVSTNRLKDSLQSIDRNVEEEISPGKFGRIDDNVKKELRKKWDTFLKGMSPEYEKQMVKVARDADLLNRVNEIAASPRGWANVFRKLETDKYGAGQLPAKTLGDLDKRLKTNFREKAMLSNAREAFDKSQTQGSRNVNLFSAWLRDVPILKYLAPVIGASVDKYGRQITMSAIDKLVVLEKIYEKQGPKQFLRAAKPIFDAAQKGNIAAALTFQFLDEGHPELLQSLQTSEEAPKETVPENSKYHGGENKKTPSDDLEGSLKRNPQRFGKFTQPLQNAAQRGPQALAAANFILQQTQPEYRKLVLEPVGEEEER